MSHLPGDSLNRGCNFLLRRLKREHEPMEINDLYKDKNEVEAIRKKLGISRAQAEGHPPEIILNLCANVLESQGYIRFYQSDREEGEFNENNDYMIMLTAKGRAFVRARERLVLPIIEF